MRVESLATTETDFFRALLDRQEETQKHLNSLPSCARPVPHSKKRATQKDKHMHPPERSRSTRFDTFKNQRAPRKADPQ